MFRTIIWFAISIALANPLVFAQGFTGTISGNFSYSNPIVFSASQVSSAAFNITSTDGASRQLQLALKLLF